MLFQEAPEYEQNFSTVMRVLEYAEVKEEDEEYESPLDRLFKAIEKETPTSVAVNTKSILVSTPVRFIAFNTQPRLIFSIRRKPRTGLPKICIGRPVISKQHIGILNYLQ